MSEICEGICHFLPLHIVSPQELDPVTKGTFVALGRGKGG